MLPVEIRAKLTKVASMGFFSKIFGAGTGKGASTMNTSAAMTALGASGSSLATEIEVSVTRTTAENMIDFMMASPMIGIDWEATTLCFALATGLLRSVMNRGYVGTCTSAIART